MLERVYSVAEMAEHFGVSKRTVYNWIDDLGLDSYITRLGGKLVIRERDLMAYLDSQRLG